MKIKHAVVGAVGILLTALAGPALATGNTYTVSVGGITTNTAYPTTSTFPSAVTLTLQGSTGSVPVSCASAALPGTTMTNGGTLGGAAPTAILDVQGPTFTTCSSSMLGGALAITSVAVGKIHGTGAATAGASDVLPVHLDGLSLQVQNAICRFNVTGKANGTFNEATQRLTVNQTGFTTNLGYTLVSGCLGRLAASGSANLSFAVTLSTSGGAINVLP